MHFSESRTSLNLAKPKLRCVSGLKQGRMRQNPRILPLASTSGSVDDGLALLDLSEAGGVP